MALNAQIAHTPDMPVFFATRRSPWQRPTNENKTAL
jgi:IS30 family transposase